MEKTIQNNVDDINQYTEKVLIYNTYSDIINDVNAFPDKYIIEFTKEGPMISERNIVGNELVIVKIKSLNMLKDYLAVALNDHKREILNDAIRFVIHDIVKNKSVIEKSIKDINNQISLDRINF